MRKHPATVIVIAAAALMGTPAFAKEKAAPFGGKLPLVEKDGATLSLTLGDDLRFAGCAVVTSSGKAKRDEAACRALMRKGWIEGMRPAAPIGDPGLWVSTEDYPPRALRNGEEGVVTIRFDVLPDGRAANCTTVISSGSADLDETACRAMLKNAVYTPPRGPAGVPASITVNQRIRWQIPFDTSEAFGLVTQRTVDGKPRDCRIVRPAVNRPISNEECMAIVAAAVNGVAHMGLFDFVIDPPPPPMPAPPPN